MSYYTTIRVKLPADTDSEAIDMANKVQEHVQGNKEFDLWADIAYVTKTEGLAQTDLINNVN